MLSFFATKVQKILEEKRKRKILTNKYCDDKMKWKYFLIIKRREKQRRRNISKKEKYNFSGGQKMRIFLQRILIFMLVAAIFFTNTDMSNAAAIIRTDSFYQMKNGQENTRETKKKTKDDIEAIPSSKKEVLTSTSDRQKENTAQKEGESKTTGQITEIGKEEKREEKDSESEKEENRKEQEKITESEKTENRKEQEKATESGKKEKQEESEQITEVGKEENSKEQEQTTRIAEEENQAEIIKKTEPEESSVPVVQSTHPDTNHNVTMPDITSHYFLLQKNSKKVTQATGKNLITVADAKAASKYIYETYTNGKLYNFTPRFTANSSVSVGGGNGGGVSFATVKNTGKKQFGDIYNAVEADNIATKVFNLQKCTENPYAIYKKVGTWYDYGNGRSYAVDMKISITGYKFPEAAVRKQLANQELKAPYAGFQKSKIGLNVMGTDYVQTKIEFFYTGTQTGVSGIKGMIQFCDIDVQQGIDFGSGFEKILMFNMGTSKLQYNATGLIGSSKGYVSSRSVENLDKKDENTTAIGIFSGNTVNCRWTLAKCDHKDTGGDAAYAVKEGYGIPAESSQADAISYYWSNSTGFLGIRADLGILPLPESINKTIYPGKINGSNSESGKKFLQLSKRNEVFSYVLSAVAGMPSNIKNVRYTEFQFEDTVDALLNIKDIKIYTDEAVSNDFQTDGIHYTDVTTQFDISKEKNVDNTTDIYAKAKAAQLSKIDFYGRTYYVHIEVQVKTDEELHNINKSITDWYQMNENIMQKVPEANNVRGSVMTVNKGSLNVSNNQGSAANRKSNYVASKIAMKLKVKKIDEYTGQPVQGVTFGLFGGSNVDSSKVSPLYTAVTDTAGIAEFKENVKGTFYTSEFGDGPYCIKEMAIPEIYKNVWNPSVNREWKYVINSLKEELLFDISENAEDKILLTNTNCEILENRIKVYKKSKDTGDYLAGAEFLLSQWSQKTEKYEDLFMLTQGKDEQGQTIYYNAQKFKNTMDNLGKYKITEKKAPEGCILTEQEWTFQMSQDNVQDESKMVFENLTTGNKQTGALLYYNLLQKGKIVIQKEDDDGQAVEGAVFTVTAEEDIYAPWDIENNKAVKDAKPLVSKGEVVDRIITGKDGKGESNKELYIGRYIVEETKGAWNHIKSDTLYKVELHYDTNNNKEYITSDLKVSNLLMHPAFAVSKLADKTTNKEKKEVAFDEEKGRYTEEKVSGIYRAGRMIDYTIQVTNTGNIPLYNIKLTDNMNSKGDKYKQILSEYVDMKTATFVLPESGEVETKKGDKISAQFSEESKLILILDHLNVKDSVKVHVKVRLKKEAKDAWKLRNEVYGEAQYDDNAYQAGEEADKTHLAEVPIKGLTDEKGNSLAMDWDYINIPGSPEEKVSKIADKTTGIAIENGEIKSGVKIPGTYNAGEKVVFSIIVKNSGTAALKKIQVKDVISNELKTIIKKDSEGFIFNEEEKDKAGLYILTTSSGKQITAKNINREEVILCTTGTEESTDRLYAGDYVVLKYSVELLPGIANLYNLSNKVYINGWYFNGNEDEQIPGAEDEDKIEVPGIPEARIAKLADKTTGVVLKEGRYDAGAKISGMYENGSDVTYKITVTNRGSTNLYDLNLTDTLSKELEEALEKNSVSFVEQTYISKQNRKVRTILEEPQKLWMDFLAAEDSVDVYLKGKVCLDTGNLFSLKNTVELTARYKKGNEEAYKEYEETVGEKIEEDKENNKKEDIGEDSDEANKADKVELSEESKKAIEKAYEEIQKLAIKEIKELSMNYEKVPVTEFMKDEDAINIPGSAVAKVAKLADKTQRVTLVRGRYEGEKKEGIYEYGDIIDYTITITNSGTADLYNILVEDIPDKELLESLQTDSIVFLTGQLETQKGEKIQVEQSNKVNKEQTEKGKASVVLDYLKAGDSVELHLKANVKSGTKESTGLNNSVHITPEYEVINEDGEKEKVYLADTPEMTDNDTIGIGVPKIIVAKKADKTKEIIMDNGRYTGKRKYGTYKSGEKVTFILTISNIGSGTAKHIEVMEEPSEELKKYINIIGFTNKFSETICTQKGNKIAVEKVKEQKVRLDKIEANDSVELTYIGKVKKDIPSIKFLKNEVSIDGQNKDGSGIPVTPKMSDYDKINLKEQSRKKVNNTRQNSKGKTAKTGDTNNITMYGIASAASVMMILIITYYKKRRNKKD